MSNGILIYHADSFMWEIMFVVTVCIQVLCTW